MNELRYSLVLFLLIVTSTSVHATSIGPVPGIRNTAPSISHDGNVLVWLYKNEFDCRICLSIGNHSDEPKWMKVPWEPGEAGPIVSGDGKRIFWQSEGGVFEADISRGGFAQIKEISVFKTWGHKFSIADANNAGDTLLLTVEGPSDPAISPLWRAAAFVKKVNGRWESPVFLTQRKKGIIINDMRLDDEGKLAYYYQGQIQVAQLNDPTAEHVVPWRQIIPGQNVSPDGNVKFSCNYLRGKDGIILRSQYQFARFENDKWGDPVTFLEFEGFRQSWGLAICNSSLCFGVIERPSIIALYYLTQYKAGTEVQKVYSWHEKNASIDGKTIGEQSPERDSVPAAR